jgi:DNA-binding response OmpR family regulator
MYMGENLVVLLVGEPNLSEPNLNEILKNRHFSVVTAENGDVALEIISKVQLPEVLVVDINNPFVNGLELIQELRWLNIQIPTIVTSTESSDDKFKQAISLGAQDCLVKPFRLEALLEKVESILK